MNRPFVQKLGLALVVTVAVTLAFASITYAGNAKVEICHLPPGNPENPQTITVSEKAVSAHLAHGDLLGPCISGCQDNSSICDDQNACTDDICLDNGNCANLPVNCDDGNPCTADSCDAAEGCINSSLTDQSCDDWNDCTANDVCLESGACSGQSIPGCCTADVDCLDSKRCTTDHCVGNTCQNEPRDCSLETVCGIPGLLNLCIVSFCSEDDGGCVTAPVSCDDSDICTDDYCDAYQGCFSLPTTTPPEPYEVSCDDGLDNDCDGATDSADSDCALSGCDVGAQRCNGSVLESCTGFPDEWTSEVDCAVNGQTCVDFGSGTAACQVSSDCSQATTLAEQMICHHNVVRATAEPTPDPPLTQFVWDEDIAAWAQAWADTCPTGHNPNPPPAELGGMSENIAWGYPTAEAVVVNGWASEGDYYNYDTDECIGSPTGTCGHYKLLVARNSTRVGCGVIFGCTSPSPFWVCNYQPGGSTSGQPY